MVNFVGALMLTHTYPHIITVSNEIKFMLLFDAMQYLMLLRFLSPNPGEEEEEEEEVRLVGWRGKF